MNLKRRWRNHLKATYGYSMRATQITCKGTCMEGVGYPMRDRIPKEA